MAIEQKSYRLVRVHDETVTFEAEYAKYYPSNLYFALFNEYPKERTDIAICQIVTQESEQTDYTLQKLIRLSNNEEAGEVLLCRKLCTVNTEAEANTTVENELYGNAILQSIFADPSDQSD